MFIYVCVSQGGQNPSMIQALVARVASARNTFPNLRFSFTLATLATGPSGDQLNDYGRWTLAALKQANLGWDKITINLMTMVCGARIACMDAGSWCGTLIACMGA